MKGKKEITDIQITEFYRDNVPFLPQYGVFTAVCKKRKCCDKYKKRGKHCGGCPKK